MKVVFFGTPSFAVPTLQMLIDSHHEVVAVVTQPDKPAGRGHKLNAPPVKKLALENDLPVWQPKSVRTAEFAEQLRAADADVAVVVAYGKILPRPVLEAPRHGCLNVHASLLPAYRGAAPIQWAIINGEAQTGITIMKLDEGLDTGPMIARRELPILDDDDTVSLTNMLSFVGAEVMLEVLETLQRDGVLPLEAQDASKATYAPLIEREMARIDWSKSADRIIYGVRGFQPWPKAFTTLEGKELKITGVDGCSRDWVPSTAFDERVEPGTVVSLFKGRGFVVRTGENGLVLVTKVQPTDKGEMSAQDLVNGGSIDLGTVLGK